MRKTRPEKPPKREGKVSLQKQIALKRFGELRARLVPKGRRAGMATEENVFKNVS